MVMAAPVVLNSTPLTVMLFPTLVIAPRLTPDTGVELLSSLHPAKDRAPIATAAMKNKHLARIWYLLFDGWNFPTP
jgi:hypothetical protein